MSPTKVQRTVFPDLEVVIRPARTRPSRSVRAVMSVTPSTPACLHDRGFDRSIAHRTQQKAPPSFRVYDDAMPSIKKEGPPATGFAVDAVQAFEQPGRMTDHKGHPAIVGEREPAP